MGIIFYFIIKIPNPEGADNIKTDYERYESVSKNFTLKNDKDWLRYYEDGIWEMSISGAPYERGVKYGILAAELLDQQEAAMIEQIETKVPSKSYLKFLKYFIGFFNRNLDHHIPLEYLQEIYGESLASPDKFDFVGPKYQRKLNYHAAHDIGHALENMKMVGCTSFGVWDEASEDGQLTIGRNFDFYFGEEFAKKKMILMVDPDKGYSFLSVSWPGMLGVVSGMNEKGLTITLNAAPSTIPSQGKTPITILAREILQYASNIEEAIEIANKRETFVSESLLIGSANDGKAIVIEKSPETTAVYESGINEIICANHFQSEELKDTEVNQEGKIELTTLPRHKRMIELLSRFGAIDLEETSKILRDQKGPGDFELGYGNEKAINQLICHHSVIFQPEQLKMWVSKPPYQLGEYILYDFREMLKGSETNNWHSADSLDIEADPFLESEDYEKFEAYLETKRIIESTMQGKLERVLEEKDIEKFIANNPDSYQAYYLSGEYYEYLGEKEKSCKYFTLSLDKPIARPSEKEEILDGLKWCKN